VEELTLLRKVRDDVADPTEEALSRARDALSARMAQQPRAARPHRVRRSRRARRVLGWTGLGTVAAIGLVLALVASNILGLAGWRGGASAAAADTLDEAAVAAITNSDPTVGPGQYLKVATRAVYSTSFGNGAGESYLTIEHDELYVPADQSDDWVWDRSASKPYQTFGPKSAKAAASAYADTLAQPNQGAEKLRAAGGRFYGSPSDTSTAALASLPRDPYQLLNYIYRVDGTSGPSPDGEALVFIADRLRSGLVPADLRAAMYRAAAMIPGVTVTEREATLDGRTGVAIGRIEPSSHIRQDIIIDPTTGLLIGERQVSLTAGSGLPAGTVFAWTAVTTSVVDSAPAGGTPNGAFDVEGCTTVNGHSVCPTN
jgi:RNA polymerase sigma-70 factor (ECF subfamily)